MLPLRTLSVTAVSTLVLLAGCSSDSPRNDAKKAAQTTTTEAPKSTAPASTGAGDTTTTVIPKGVNDGPVVPGGSVNSAPPSPTLDAIAVGTWTCPTLMFTATLKPDKTFTVVVTGERGSANGTWSLDASGAKASGDGVNLTATPGEGQSVVGSGTIGNEPVQFSVTPTSANTLTIVENGEAGLCTKA